MDMKKILQAVDGASTKKPAEGSNDMKKFMQIVEGKGPLNRLTAAESLVMQQPVKKKTITNPVLNVSEDAKPSTIGKYFRSVQEELLEADQKHKDRAKQIAERVATKLEAANPAQQAAIAIAKKKKKALDEQYSYRDIAEMARQGLSDEEIAEQLGFDLKEGLKDPKDNPCWKGYKPVGTKQKGGRTVPNCVPKEGVQKMGPAGQLKGKAKPDVKGTVLGSPEKSQKGLRNKLVGGD